MKVKKLAKLMQKYINNQEFVNEIYKKSNSIDIVNKYMATTLEYLICTNGDKLDAPLYDINIKKIFDLGRKTLQNRIVDNAVMTHSFNGYNLTKAKKYGLGSQNIRDPKIDKCFDLLEKAFGSTSVSPYTKNQTNTANEIYMCSPGVKTFYYANAQSPERLYMGILYQFRDDALPVVIGQTKEEYMLSVAYQKVENCCAENKEELYDAAKYLIHAFCSKKPVIAIFPAQSKKYNLNVSHAINKNLERPLKEVIDQNIVNPLDYFSKEGEYAETNNLGNLVAYGTIPPKDLSFVEVPDRFEILQQLAYARGMKKGEKIDYFTGQKYESKIEKEFEDVKNVPTSIIQQEDVELPQNYKTNKEKHLYAERQM